MRKKYIRPSVELVRHISETPILAGSPGTGSFGAGGDPKQGVGGGGGEDEEPPVETGAKYNQFSSWENWDEY